jgi:MarR family transcriptional repressor of emrRAB
VTKASRSATMRTANLLGALALELMERVERLSKRHPNETSSSMAALNVIGFYEGCSNNALSQALGLSHTAAVRLVDKLEASGLVASETGVDRRSVALKLTPSGRERAQELVSKRCRHLCGMLDILSEDDQRHLARISEILLKSLVDAASDADHICRLCDETSCPPDQCPVHNRAVAIDSAARA